MKLTTPFVAKYPGICWWCGTRFPEKETIRFYEEETIHDHCLPEVMHATSPS